MVTMGHDRKRLDHGEAHHRQRPDAEAESTLVFEVELLAIG